MLMLMIVTVPKFLTFDPSSGGWTAPIGAPRRVRRPAT